MSAPSVALKGSVSFYFRDWANGQIPYLLDALIATAYMKLYKNTIKLVSCDIKSTSLWAAATGSALYHIVDQIDRTAQAKDEETLDGTARTLVESSANSKNTLKNGIPDGFEVFYVYRCSHQLVQIWIV